MSLVRPYNESVECHGGERDSIRNSERYAADEHPISCMAMIQDALPLGGSASGLSATDASVTTAAGDGLSNAR
jgi:hypothetical protein